MWQHSAPPSKTPVDVLSWIYARVNQHARVDQNDQAGRQTGRATNTSGLHLRSCQVLTDFRHTICGYNAKDIMPLINWRREALEEEVLNNLSWKDDKGQSSIRPTLDLFESQHYGNFSEMGWSTMWAFRSSSYHLELVWTTKIGSSVCLCTPCCQGCLQWRVSATGGIIFLRMYLWWSLCTLCSLACKVELL